MAEHYALRSRTGHTSCLPLVSDPVGLVGLVVTSQSTVTEVVLPTMPALERFVVLVSMLESSCLELAATALPDQAFIATLMDLNGGADPGASARLTGLDSSFITAGRISMGQDRLSWPFHWTCHHTRQVMT